MADTRRWLALQDLVTAAGTVFGTVNVKPIEVYEQRGGESAWSCFYAMVDGQAGEAQHTMHDETVGVELVIVYRGEMVNAARLIDEKLGELEVAVLQDTERSGYAENTKVLGWRRPEDGEPDAKSIAAMRLSMVVRRNFADPFTRDGA